MKRILLKLSGEALAGTQKTGFDESVVEQVGKQVKTLIDQGIQVGVVIGGGNFWRGRSSESMNRSKADQIGMLATVMNCIYTGEVFRGLGLDTSVYTPFSCGGFTKIYNIDQVEESLNNNQVVFLQVERDIHIFPQIQRPFCAQLKLTQILSCLQRLSMEYMTLIRR